MGSTLSSTRLLALLDEHAPLRPVPLVPSVLAWWAEDEVPLWMALEREVERAVTAPFFCVPWPGAQALALAVERGLIDVRGKTVIDVGCGSGVASIACARRGALAIATDIDPLACRAASLMAARNGVALRVLCADLLANPDLLSRVDVVLAGDVVYSKGQAELLTVALERWARKGVDVVLADSGRPFFSAGGLTCVLEEQVRVPRGVEGADSRVVRVFASRSVGRD